MLRGFDGTCLCAYPMRVPKQSKYYIQGMKPSYNGNFIMDHCDGQYCRAVISAKYILKTSNIVVIKQEWSYFKRG